MKIITEIKVLETKNNIHEIADQAYNPNNSFIEFGSEPIAVDIVRELIKGRRRNTTDTI